VSRAAAGAAEAAALARAKARLDGLDLYPRPVRIRRVRIAVAPWLFRLPWFRRFHGYAIGPLILLRRPLAQASPALIAHELTHVWQCQHGLVRMWLSYVLTGYHDNRYEIEARFAAGQGERRRS